MPLFDLMLLGLGDDGHTASLLPGQPVLQERSAGSRAVPQGRDEPRITLTYPALESSRLILFLVAGAAKRDALAQAGAGAIPAGGFKPQGEVMWLVDRAAAGDDDRLRILTARIEDYAMIGDCRTAALVGRERLDRLAVHAALRFRRLFRRPVGHQEQWPLADRAAVRKFAHQSRRYRGDSLILETIFTTATGKARVIDFMPPGTAGKLPSCASSKALAGHVDMRTELVIRFDYGITIPWVHRDATPRHHDRRGGPTSSHHPHPRRSPWREHAFGGRIHGEEGRARCPL